MNLKYFPSNQAHGCLFHVSVIIAYESFIWLILLSCRHVALFIAKTKACNNFIACFNRIV